MPMPPYSVVCTVRGCSAPAVYKIAARWSDGVTHELKTYSLVCSACRESALAEARQRRSKCRLAPGETLEDPEAFPFGRIRSGPDGK